MRLVALALSTVLMTGCSWAGSMFGSGGHKAPGYSKPVQYKAQNTGRLGPCQVRSSYDPIPAGCHPSNVTIATSGHGGFPQQPNFNAGYAPQGAGQSGYTTGQYGSHASGQQQRVAAATPQKRKPRLRGQLSIGAEKSFSGDFLDFGRFPDINPAASYNPNDFIEDFETQVEGTIPGPTETVDLGGGLVTSVQTEIPTQTTTTTTFFSDIERINQPNISFDDVHSTPIRIAGGLEFIVAPRTTVFANGGYSYAEGDTAGGATVQAEIRQNITETTRNANTGEIIGTPISNTPFIPNEEVATFEFEGSDFRRVDFEVGARHYFDPLFKNFTHNAITPFVGASAGASRFNEQTISIRQRQRFLQRAFESGGETTEFFEVVPDTPSTSTTIYEAQWVPSGAVTAGVEWQVSPRTALAFETGIRVEGARELSNGAQGDTNVAVPFSIRGSYNF